MNYTTKEKGNIGLAKTIVELVSEKIHVSIPIEEDLPYDLIAECDFVCKRVQVRFCTPTNGVLKVKLQSSWSDKKGNHYKQRKQNDYDVLAVYCPETDMVYFLNASDFENTCWIHLRLKESKVANQHKTRLISEFLGCKKLWRGGRVV